MKHIIQLFVILIFSTTASAGELNFRVTGGSEVPWSSSRSTSALRKFSPLKSSRVNSLEQNPYERILLKEIRNRAKQERKELERIRKEERKLYLTRLRKEQQIEKIRLKEQQRKYREARRARKKLLASNPPKQIDRIQVGNGVAGDTAAHKPQKPAKRKTAGNWLQKSLFGW